MLILFGGCKEKFVANIHFPATGYLVVEGFINAGNGPTNIRLTRATSLDSPYIKPESGAEVFVESQNGQSFYMAEIASGVFTINQIPIDNTQQYRLHIKTSNGKDYISDFTSIKITPPIDSVTYTISNDAASIFVSSHDDQNKTIYYQWQFIETWKYESAYTSYYEFINDSLIFRPGGDQIYECWISDSSTQINIASSAKLKSDVIFNYPLATVPYAGSDKLINRYSILVKQIALSEDWFNWEQKIKKNTEQLGTIFDAQPSEITGNIHNSSDPSEPVIGFIGCTTQTELRAFIDRTELPYTARFVSGYEDCTLDSILSIDPAVLAGILSPYVLPIALKYEMMIPVGVYYSGVGCVDCRQKGGTSIKPDFWR